MPVLAGMTGLAVDMGRLYTAQARLQGAVDAAALAGTLYLGSDPSINNGTIANVVATYLDENYPEASVVDLGPGTAVRTVCLTGQVDVPMTFMGVLGIESRTVSASACAGFNDLEVVLVIDNTGSMNGSPINAVKTAANKLVDLMIPGSTAPAIKVGLVPFRGKVRIGANVDGLPAGCRNANGTVNNSNVSSPDDSCKDGAMPVTLALSYSKTTIKNAINSMTAGNSTRYASGTIISEGIKWGRHVLTPEPPYTQGGLTTKVRKVMIVLTDGDNEDGTCGGTFGSCDPRTSSTCAYRRNAYFQQSPPVTNCNCNNYGCLDQAMLNEAQLAKNAGIEIFSIRYGESDSVDIALMKAIASSTEGTDDHYFDAPSTSDIGKVFDKIGRQLGYRLL